jgi:hypothetical protein
MPLHHPRSVLLPLFLGTILGSDPGLAVSLDAQTPASAHPERTLVLQAGQWHVDLDGTVAAARVELPLGKSGSWLFVPGLTYAHGSLRSPMQSDVLVPEALFHFQLSQGRVRPYVGGGGGMALGSLRDRAIDPVLTLGSGLRADISREWGARLEADMRLFGRMRAGSVGWSLGVARGF